MALITICLSQEGHGMACRSQTIEPYYLNGYGGTGSTMAAAPAEPMTLLSQRAGRRHSLGMPGSQCAEWLVTWCHIIDSLWASHSHVPQCHRIATKCHMTAFAATTDTLWRRRADELQGAAMSVPATPIPFPSATLTPAFSTPTTSPNVAHPATTVY